jgi:hypothetical protein
MRLTEFYYWKGQQLTYLHVAQALICRFCKLFNSVHYFFCKYYTPFLLKFLEYCTTILHGSEFLAQAEGYYRRLDCSLFSPAVSDALTHRGNWVTLRMAVTDFCIGIINRLVADYLFDMDPVSAPSTTTSSTSSPNLSYPRWWPSVRRH